MFFNLNIRRTKGLVWTLNIVAILCITGLFLLIYQAKAKGDFKPRDPKFFRKALDQGIEKEQMSGGPKKIDINDYSALWNAPISGIERKEAEIADTGDVDLVTDDPLEHLVQVMVILNSTDPLDSRVRLNYPKQEAAVEKPFKLDVWSKEGDALKPPYDEHPYFGKVLQIHDDGVVFSFRGEEQILYPEFILPHDQKGSADKAKNPSAVPEEVADLHKNPPVESVEYKPGHWYLSPMEQKRISTDYEKLLRESPVVARKNKKTGKTELTLTAVPENSLASQRGFTKGDVLISINDIPIHNKAGAINYFKEHPEETVFTVKYLRNGREMTKTFVAPPQD